MKGRKPKTAAQRRSDGDTRKVGVNKLRERIESIPEPIRGLPDAPEYLGEMAAQKYMEWAEQLRSMSQDYQCDAPMLESASMAFEQSVKAYKVLKEKGQTIEIYKEAKRGGELFCTGVHTRPEVAVWVKCSTLVKSFCSEMGLSLVSRTRLTIEKKNDAETEMMAALSAPRLPRTTQVQ